jgi:phosphoglycerol transferase MdoB-like AlkP superfamily enzyme
VSLCSGFRVVMSVAISASRRFSVRLYPQSFVGELVSYLGYLYLFAHSAVQLILCDVFVLFSFVLCILYYQFFLYCPSSSEKQATGPGL